MSMLGACTISHLLLYSLIVEKTESALDLNTGLRQACSSLFLMQYCTTSQNS